MIVFLAANCELQTVSLSGGVVLGPIANRSLQRVLPSEFAMTLDYVNIFFQVIVFLFAISVHESAHAWMAWRLGDPTARMLGRVSLNPLRHIDPIGTVLLPALALFYHFPMIGWAKPTPVDPRNFKNEMRDDILTSVAGPVSNFLIAILSILILRGVLTFGGMASFSESPITQLLILSIEINVLLGVFNLIPIPPLDGSHVLRHMLPDRIRQVYDRVGMFGLLLLFLVGGRVIGFFSNLVLGFLLKTFLGGII
jgi:Zn-dependent protease